MWVQIFAIIIAIFTKKLSLEDLKGGVKAMQGRVGIKEKAVRWNLTAWVSVIRLEPDNIVVTKSFSEYCNVALSVVHESHTATFQCSSPLFHWVLQRYKILLEP